MPQFRHRLSLFPLLVIATVAVVDCGGGGGGSSTGGSTGSTPAITGVTLEIAPTSGQILPGPTLEAISWSGGATSGTISSLPYTCGAGMAPVGRGGPDGLTVAFTSTTQWEIRRPVGDTKLSSSEQQPRSGTIASVSLNGAFMLVANAGFTYRWQYASGYSPLTDTSYPAQSTASTGLYIDSDGASLIQSGGNLEVVSNFEDTFKQPDSQTWSHQGVFSTASEVGLVGSVSGVATVLDQGTSYPLPSDPSYGPATALFGNGSPGVVVGYGKTTGGTVTWLAWYPSVFNGTATQAVNLSAMLSAKGITVNQIIDTNGNEVLYKMQDGREGTFTIQVRQ